ncbi:MULTISPECIES: hypothetical protein [Rhodococcus]|uniref:hypothetical protein n=1 Tax=Rhodococcus TaxID=1827 RepID=UPI000BA27BCA|nr:hypothetical protein [Rhodococcus pyridinivorans]MCD2116738.1 hypothetical protein [Rhodococcus pyridinivorans]MCZ4626054.1 hypothetical protein [Rhodococcus pyridinivorans]MCZ4647009.1 hypothetical protein [Rhodococcus pyridinivorans]MDJ0484234.1 hypothetical protein [Rhodococcus pyridinivorans]MDV7253113.1 hypothetical protein [Rhodococcus pyridinivorans]
MTDTLLASIDRILSEARTDLQVLDQTADSRTLTPDEVHEVRYLRKLIDAETRVRARILAELE